MNPEISRHFRLRQPSAIRVSQIEFLKRKDNVQAVNTAIGNVSLPMHPAMQKRMFSLDSEESPFRYGVVQYSPTEGINETKEAFLNIISSSGFDTRGLQVQITEGGSQAMELVILGICGNAGTGDRPLMLIDAAYTNYMAMARRTGRRTVSVTRHLHDHGKFSLPDINEVEKVIREYRPGGVVVIPYDNPTGHFYDHKSYVELAKILVKYNLWLISDEAYRELHYVDHDTVSVWGITNKEVPGIEGRRVSIETSSKVWNACGLRIGALVSDNREFVEKSIAENTANLCPNVIGQYIFGSLAHESTAELREWFKKQRAYYHSMLQDLTGQIKKILPGIVISSPDASIYQILDVRNIVKPGFDAKDFVYYCAAKGKVEIDGKYHTLLVSPMEEFYNLPREKNPGLTQMRIAYVETPGEMEKVPRLFSKLLKNYEKTR